MSAKTTELKPCPFCGSGNVRYKEAEHAVVCARCKARRSIAPDEEMAIRMWDERAGELKPDSWEKLEEDVNLGCRDYCEKHRLEECDYNMRVHMLDRAKKLAGIEEAER
ncbi:Lar family restriction alleviation protein [uncultured Slackia sp.]|uniref:Lar family restriction alleviation protein n=1 Tax=uncultured Slackia sp. TaxID=665903 RepID=UPI00267441FA|nr:Lar family restriction alleviation protein [uncultured Slackia sp.]